MNDVIDHYDRLGVVDRIDGSQPIEAVASDILDHLRAESVDA
jgi:hypothetical protein